MTSGASCTHHVVVLLEGVLHFRPARKFARRVVRQRICHGEQGRRPGGEVILHPLAPLGEAGHRTRIVREEPQVGHEVGSDVLQVDFQGFGWIEGIRSWKKR